jgi:hypothetical protein
VIAGLGVVVAVAVGSRGLADVDPGLAGYLAATLVTAVVFAYQASAFWRRPAAAVYARTLARAVGHPRQLVAAFRSAGRDLAAQRFIARRGRGRWLAHLALSGGTLGSFAVTLPLVWGWLRFRAEDPAVYRVYVAGVPVARFPVDGIGAWLVFHALVLCGIAVTFGTTYFLVVRLRARALPGVTAAAHTGPLVLLLAVALTGLTLPIASHVGTPALFRATALVHEAAVVLLLVALSTTKLAHVLVRPLQVGSRLLRTPDAPPERCAGCGAAFAPAAQAAAVRALLPGGDRGGGDHGRSCPACRRRRVARAHTHALDTEFQPQALAARGRR